MCERRGPMGSGGLLTPSGVQGQSPSRGSGRESPPEAHPFYSRDAMLARVMAIATCLSGSVRLSVTRRYCVKTKKATVIISSLPGSPKTLLFSRQISSPNSKEFPPSGGLKEGWVGKFSDFLALGVNISKTVADTAKVTLVTNRKSYMGFRLTSISMTLNDLELL